MTFQKISTLIEIFIFKNEKVGSVLQIFQIYYVKEVYLMFFSLSITIYSFISHFLIDCKYFSSFPLSLSEINGYNMLFQKVHFDLIDFCPVKPISPTVRFKYFQYGGLYNGQLRKEFHSFGDLKIIDFLN